MKTVTLISKKTTSVLFGMIIIVMFTFTAAAVRMGASPKSAPEAIEIAKKQHQYLFILFYDKKDDSYQAMGATIKKFMNRYSGKVLTYQVLTTNKKEIDTVARYKVDQAQCPVLVALAPNGAVTGVFSQMVDEQQLRNCLVSDLIMNILKSTQEGKIVLALFQNKKTKFNQESTSAAISLSNEPGLKGSVAIIKADPDVPKNKEYLAQYLADPSLSEAAIILIMPSGNIGGIYRGKTTKNIILNDVTSALNGSQCSSWQ
ncbi:MAG: hypothetical protein K6U80_18010 [Firmicutes bacterium]|nr:hypothetical protein [Bacillota bacterium]